MTTTTDMQGQAAANLQSYRTATATGFWLDDTRTRAIVVQTDCIDTARAVVARRDHAPIVQREVG